MVQTRSAAKRTESGKVHAEDEVLPDDTTAKQPSRDDASPLAKKSRRRDATVSKRSRRGKPGELCRLNLDVLFLIAAYIHPIDLLNLARTCKSLRELLMDKSSAFVWKTARQQAVGLPDCPADLTEPEYANLVFYARCHGCGKYASTILWNIRRRYCPACRGRQLCRFATSPEAISKNNNVLPWEYLEIHKEHNNWLDRSQVTAFMHEYHKSPDRNKQQFISDKQKQYIAIRQHVEKCEFWQKQNEAERKVERARRREEREKRIFERLEQNGYQREIAYFGHTSIVRSRISDFRTCRPLTDREWDRMLPEWIEIMDKSRLKRIEEVVYTPRRYSLASAYERYVRHPSPDAPTFDLLPHMSDLARFPLFRGIIKAPEDTPIDGESFASAFAQLPTLVAEWKKKVDTELAELVKIPLHLSSGNASSCRVLESGSTTRAESSEADSIKLQLACAVFQIAGSGVFTHLDALSAATPNYRYCTDDSECPGTIPDRLGIHFLEEAPYIVHACGLDPNVAKVDDMDRRDARLRCLCPACSRNVVMDWRNAMRHSYSLRYFFKPPFSESPRWQLIGDEHIAAIQTVEQSIEKKSSLKSKRCLLCRRCVGYTPQESDIYDHLYNFHKLTLKRDEIKQGVHYTPISICDSLLKVEIVEEGERVTFRPYGALST